MAKRSARKHKEMLCQVKEEMELTGDAVFANEKWHTIFTRERNITDKTPRKCGLTKRQAVSQKRRELIRKERSQRYQQIIDGTYESGLKFEHTSKEQYGSMLKFNDKVPDFFLQKNGLSADSIMLLVNSSSLDHNNEGRIINVLGSTGAIFSVRAGWVESAV